MNDLVKQFKEAISKISKEEYLKVWEELKDFNEIGPIAAEYVEQALFEIRNSQLSSDFKSAKVIGIEKSEFSESDLFNLAA